jgi:hypothetical protein
MSLKKVLTIGAVCLGFSTAAYSGGPEILPPPCPIFPIFIPYIYIGGSLGWAYSNWQDFIATGAHVNADTNGFTAGGKIGYQFWETFGVEAGGFVLPDSDQSVTIVPPQPDTAFTLNGDVSSWIAYGAATLRAPLFYPFVHVMGKVGGVYRALNHSGCLYKNNNNHHDDDDNNYATVIFGATLEFDLGIYNLPLAVSADYYYIPGSNDTFFKVNNNFDVIVNEDAAPAAQIVVGTLSFKFAV